MSKRIKVVIAEDQELMRKSLVALLGDYKCFEVVGEAANGKELLHLLKTIHPDIVLLDIEMPLMNGMETISILSVKYPAAKVIILSMHINDTLIVDFMTKGAKAYLAKGCDVDTLIKTIKQVNDNGFYFSDQISKAMLNNVMKERSINPFLDELALTDREIESAKYAKEKQIKKLPTN